MADNKLEKLLVEAMKNLLDQDELGRVDADYEERSHHTQFQYEDINRDFALAIKDSDFFNSLTAIFYKIHSYKWIDDTKFEQAMIDDLESMGVPNEEIENALNALDKVRKQYLGNDYSKDEADVGWPEDMEGIKQVTQEPHNKPVSDSEKETFSGDNEPYSGSEPDKTRPVPMK